MYILVRYLDPSGLVRSPDYDGSLHSAPCLKDNGLGFRVQGQGFRI